MEHFSAINDLRAKIIAEEIEIKKDVETCWGIKESEVIIEADEISTDTDDDDSDEV